MSQINDLELAVRTIEELLPDMPIKALEKWKGILTTALLRLEEELNSTLMHTCSVCGYEEYGYRTQLPVGWREKGDLVICFHHEDKEIAEQLQKVLETDKPEPVDIEKTLEELMAAI